MKKEAEIIRLIFAGERAIEIHIENSKTKILYDTGKHLENCRTFKDALDRIGTHKDNLKITGFQTLLETDNSWEVED